jgi:hypothetical protein
LESDWKSVRFLSSLESDKIIFKSVSVKDNRYGDKCTVKRKEARERRMNNFPSKFERRLPLEGN